MKERRGNEQKMLDNILHRGGRLGDRWREGRGLVKQRKVNRREKVGGRNSKAKLLEQGEQKDSAMNECSEDRRRHKVGKKRIK